MKCSNCYTDNDDNGKYCKSCGKVIANQSNQIEIVSISENQSKAQNVFAYVIFGILIVIILFVVLKIISNEEESLNGKEENSTKAEMIIFVKGGEFIMGSEIGAKDEKPLHKVLIKDFYIDKYEVTVGDYIKYCDATGAIMPEPPNWGWRENDPIVNVTWYEANAYAKWKGMRLPTEAEWEYAAAEGNIISQTIYSGSKELSEVGWYSENSRNIVNRVGSRKSNALDIYDMSGNVWEWCSDWYDEYFYKISPFENPSGPLFGSYRVLRGGSWSDYEYFCRIAIRYYYAPTFRNNNLGFRCVKDL